MIVPFYAISVHKNVDIKKTELLYQLKTETYLTLSWRRSLSYRNQSIDMQWTGFYMIGTSVMKELRVCRTSIMELSANIFNSKIPLNTFIKRLHVNYLTGSYIRLWNSLRFLCEVALYCSWNGQFGKKVERFLPD